MFGIISKVLMRTLATDDFSGTQLILSLYPSPKMTIRTLILYWYFYYNYHMNEVGFACANVEDADQPVLLL